ncbi:MAG: TPM domain-containing protein [Oscillospiraceae bacterium]|jgi:uncharacterized protein|nr:TPM domain-containing protein [Oscillospiraceae bacterium]
MTGLSAHSVRIPKPCVFRLFICIIISIICLYSVRLSAGAALLHPALPRVIDNATLLTAAEEQKLTDKIETMSAADEFDYILLTEQSIGGKAPVNYADDYYVNNGYGYRPASGSEYTDGDGVLFLLDMGERDWYFGTYGRGIRLFSDYELDSIGSQILSDLSGGRYYKAFDAFLDLAHAEVMTAAGSQEDDSYGDGSYYENGRYYGDDHGYDTSLSPTYGLGVGLLLGLAIAAIVVVVMKRKMNTARAQRAAANYEVPGAFYLSVSRDDYLYQNTTRTPIPQQTNTASGRGGGRSGGGSFGGGSVHMNSGGGFSGGRGGKF